MSKVTKKLVELGLVIVVATGAAVALGAVLTDPPFEQARESVVIVKSAVGGGTGFITRAKSGRLVLITNWHVCTRAENGKMMAERAGEFSDMPRRIIGVAPENDLCALEPAPGTPLRLGEHPRYFDKVYVLGHPFHKPQTPSEGRYMSEGDAEMVYPTVNGACPPSFEPFVSPFGDVRCATKMPLGEVTNPTYPGNSGSPLLDQSGGVIGVINATDERDAHGSFVPLSELRKFLGRF